MFSPPALPAFNPTEDLVPQVLHDLSDPDLSFRAVAARYATTVPALSTWLARPDIAPQLDSIHSVIARRTRLVSADSLPAAAATCARILQTFNAQPASSHVPASDSAFPSTPRHLDTSTPSSVTPLSALRAASLLLRLARYSHLPPPPPRPRTDHDTATLVRLPRPREFPRSSSLAGFTPEGRANVAIGGAGAIAEDDQPLVDVSMASRPPGPTYASSPRELRTPSSPALSTEAPPESLESIISELAALAPGLEAISRHLEHDNLLPTMPPATSASRAPLDPTIPGSVDPSHHDSAIATLNST